MNSLKVPKFKRLPRHVGIIPDGNRRWSTARGLPKHAGYKYGIAPGLELYRICHALGIEEMTFYGFTQDNTKRPAEQTRAFQRACVEAVEKLAEEDAELLVVGNTDSPLFPKELLPYTKRVKFGRGSMRVNFLVNYSWNWDLSYFYKNNNGQKGSNIVEHIASSEISRIDLIVRWGGRRRLSGFLPVQSIYSDFYVVDEMWPDFKPEHFFSALEWYQTQDVTLGG
ncbi:MAG TPA: dihydroorotate dehydrogenase [Peptococcaceae bacterium]|nr:MAG: Undecaprenyl pyrophosphate synthase [Clostridia bacterium 41_269]HBT20834.1 dihydroorotate dehydrogenase [Peptococcaceae bacterium]